MPNRIYTPFFYIIEDTITKKYYAGYNSTSDYKLFMTESGYKTSSKYVNLIIKKCGLSRFKINRIKLFKTKTDAYKYETRFLRKVDAANNNKFINLHNNIGVSPSFGTEEFDAIMIQKYGVKNCMQLPNVVEKIKEKWTDEKRKERSEFLKLLWKNDDFSKNRKEKINEYISKLSIEDKKNIYGVSSLGKKRDPEKYKKGALKRCSDPNFSKKLSLACTGIHRKPRSKIQCINCNNYFTFQNIKRHEQSCSTNRSQGSQNSH